MQSQQWEKWRKGLRKRKSFEVWGGRNERRAGEEVQGGLGGERHSQSSVPTTARSKGFVSLSSPGIGSVNAEFDPRLGLARQRLGSRVLWLRNGTRELWAGFVASSKATGKSPHPSMPCTTGNTVLITPPLSPYLNSQLLEAGALGGRLPLCNKMKSYGNASEHSLPQDATHGARSRRCISGLAPSSSRRAGPLPSDAASRCSYARGSLGK